MEGFRASSRAAWGRLGIALLAVASCRTATAPTPARPAPSAMAGGSAEELYARGLELAGSRASLGLAEDHVFLALAEFPHDEPLVRLLLAIREALERGHGCVVEWEDGQPIYLDLRAIDSP